MASALVAQIERLLEQTRRSERFDKALADGLVAVTRAADKLIELSRLVNEKQGQEAGTNDRDIAEFFASVDRRIDELADERAAGLVAENAIGFCPSCGAAIGPADAA